MTTNDRASANGRCPIPIAMRRYDELHRFWHRSMDNYVDPDAYLADLNAAIQASRNVTFALQNNKANLPRFDDWYAIWQQRMRADVIFSWANEARVRIVHGKDLETNSVTRVRLILDYADAADEYADELDEAGDIHPAAREPVDAPALIQPREVAAFLLDAGVPRLLVEEGVVSIERRWEDSALPGRELNGALAHLFAVLGSLLADGHRQAEASCDHPYGHGETLPVSDGNVGAHPRPPACMATTRQLRTRTVSINDLTEIRDGIERSVAFDPHLAAIAARRYVGESGRPVKPVASNAVTVIDHLPTQIEHAKAILRSGEDHGWFMFFYRGAVMVGNRFLAAENAQQKRKLAQSMAEVVLDLDATGVLEVGEVWWVPGGGIDDENWARPGNRPDRKEALSLVATTMSGRSVSAFIPFERPGGVGGPVFFEETVIQEDATSNFLAPIRAAWEWKKRHRPAPAGSSFTRSIPVARRPRPGTDRN
jgi:hypothetical protein